MGGHLKHNTRGGNMFGPTSSASPLASWGLEAYETRASANIMVLDSLHRYGIGYLKQTFG